MNLFFILAVLALIVAGYVIGVPNTPVTSATASAPAQQPAGGSNVSGHVSDGSLTGAPITPDVSTWPGSDTDKIWNICTAVALAEGFNLGPGTAPYDLNNPGDLSPGDEGGFPTAGPAQAHGGSEIIFFATCEGGFSALYAKFARIVTGASTVYPASWSWAQVAAQYAGNAGNWLANVTNYLGVDPSSTPQSYVNG